MKNIFIAITLLFASTVAFAQNATEPKSNSDKLSEFFTEKIIKYTEKGEVAIEKTIETFSAEAGPLFEDYITWSIIKHLTDCISVVGFTLIFCLIAFSSYKKIKSWNDADFGASHISFIASMMIIVLSAPGWFAGKTNVVEDIRLAAQAYFSPKFYAISQLSEYIKK